jgi:hypothetical protein
MNEKINKCDEDKRNNENQDEADDEYEQEDEILEESVFIKDDKNDRNCNRFRVDLPRTKSSHKICVVCDRKNEKKKLISKAAIINAFLKSNILIPYGSRACKKHFNESNILKEEELDNLKIEKSYILLKSDEIKFTIQILRYAAIKNNFFDKFKDTLLLDNSTCESMTGNFNQNIPFKYFSL